MNAIVFETIGNITLRRIMAGLFRQPRTSDTAEDLLEYAPTLIFSQNRPDLYIMCYFVCHLSLMLRPLRPSIMTDCLKQCRFRLVYVFLRLTVQ